MCQVCEVQTCMCMCGYSNGVHCVCARAHVSVYVCVLMQVVDMREVTHLKNLKALSSLNLSNNPIEVSRGRVVCVHACV